jgi:hypothetical protein
MQNSNGGTNWGQSQAPQAQDQPGLFLRVLGVVLHLAFIAAGCAAMWLGASHIVDERVLVRAVSLVVFYIGAGWTWGIARHWYFGKDGKL